MNETTTDSRDFRRLRVLLIVTAITGIAVIALALVILLRDPSATVAAQEYDETSLSQPRESPVRFLQVQPFELTERDGSTVTRDTLAGHPWVAAFVFTRCTGPCPRISSSMRALQERFAQAPAGREIRLVTFSVDPEYDTPQVLQDYARSLGADPVRWLFLTGTSERIRELSTASFQLPIERSSGAPVGESVTHRTVLTVIDAQGFIRGYYDGETEAGVAQTAARALFLAEGERRP